MAHLAWADRRVLEALRGAAAPDPRAIELFAHVLGAEHVWLARLSGAPAEVPVWPRIVLDECERLADANRARLDAFLESLGPDDLTRSVAYTNSAGQPFTTAIEDILLHVAMHGSYHRGQIAWLLRQGGDTPAPTDVIGFVRGAPAATRQPGS